MSISNSVSPGPTPPESNAGNDDAAAQELLGKLPDPKARAELVEMFRPLALHLANRYARRGQDADDLQQVAMLGLLNAIDRFDPEYGSRFVSFAVPTITGELKRYFRDAGWGIGVPRRLKDARVLTQRANSELAQRLGRRPTVDEIARHTGLHPEDVTDAAALGNAYQPDGLDAPIGKKTAFDFVGMTDDRFDLIVDLNALGSILETRSDRDRELIRLRFVESLTQRQIAERLGISQMHVSRLLAACLEDIRTLLT